MISLADKLTVVIPTQIDCIERALNTQLVIDWTLEFFDLPILVVESGPHSKLDLGERRAEHVFVKSTDSIYNKCRWMNFGYRMVRTPYVLQLDVDCLLHPDDIVDGMARLESGARFFFPHNGEIVDVPRRYHSLEILKPLLLADFRPSDFSRRNPQNQTAHGGAFFFEWRAFYQAGMENEHYAGWGAEDTDRWLRLTRLGHVVEHGVHPFFHLEHPRPATQWYESEVGWKNFDRAQQWLLLQSEREVANRIAKLRRQFDPAGLFL